MKTPKKKETQNGGTKTHGRRGGAQGDRDFALSSPDPHDYEKNLALLLHPPSKLGLSREKSKSDQSFTHKQMERGGVCMHVV